MIICYLILDLILEAFHEDCDNKGILYYFYSSKHLILLRFNLSDYAQQ